ncbi:TetR/AcrR family transcriptional regulator [Kitasatospora sp. LaBMicrA B282]|uniref:TetR/AcrR family transcriptional regulator n=1 Tax=Kitasatospora sp. LaBMicrA B282 TaxID=3420949 RepID=UPI003D0C9F94
MSDEQQLPSVWTRPRRERREQPALSREQIVAAALELLDAEGIDALSMRKLGTRLNAGATSMYSHVANKDELIELVLDEVFGEIEVVTATDTGEDWRSTVIACGQNLRAAFLRHPWVVSVLGEVGLAYLGPNMLRLSERLLGVFEDGGFDVVAADRAVAAVLAFVIGRATSEAAWLTTLKRSGQTEQEYLERLLPAAEQAVQDYPRLRRLYTAQREQEAAGRQLPDPFAEGLGWLLDGLTMPRG